ncbi:MAG: HAD family hydrolase [Actinomycetota bacterium]|nr:HAD family hydrolase [Actinomycetota bacterium]
MATPRSVLFDWRGTLVVTLTEQGWAHRALERLGRAGGPDAAREVVRRIEAVPEVERLWGPGVDTDAELHRAAYFQVFAAAGLDDDLAGALYDVESDWRCNPFAADAVPVLHALARRGVRVAVISDIHFDIRPAFAAAGLDSLVELFVLSFEHGVQKPDPAIFRRAIDGLGVAPAEALMVGDRAAYDGRAVDVGIPTLLVPPLTGVEDRRLHLVNALLAAPSR